MATAPSSQPREASNPPQAGRRRVALLTIVATLASGLAIAAAPLGPAGPAQAVEAPVAFEGPTPLGLEFPNQGGITAQATGDVDGDGNADVVVASFRNMFGSEPEVSRVSVFLGQGNGTFDTPTHLATPGAQNRKVIDLALGDVDGNGTLDIVGAHHEANQLLVYEGAGDGTFAPALTVALSARPIDLALAALSSGSPLDAVVLLDNNTFAVLEGNGDGTFGSPTAHALGMNDNRQLAAADLTGDGRPEVVVGAWDHGLKTFVNDGNGALTTTVGGGLSPYFQVSGFQLGDVDGDGTLDVLAGGAFGGCGSVTCTGVFLGNGDGSFTIPPDGDPKWVAATGWIVNDSTPIASDLFGTGSPAFVVTFTGIAVVGVAEVRPGDTIAWSFQAIGNNGQFDATSVVAAEFDAVPGPDLVIGGTPAAGTTEGLFFAPGDPVGPRRLKLPFVGRAGSMANGVGTGDVNGDGFDDVVSINATTSQGTLWLGQADGRLGPPDTDAVELGQKGCNFKAEPLLRDIDGDGRLDVVCGMGLAWGFPDLTFHDPVVLDPGWGSVDNQVVGDLDGDGYLDIVQLHTDRPCCTSYAWLRVLNHVPGEPRQLQQVSSTHLGSGFRVSYGLAIGDVDEDGALDVVAIANSGPDDELVQLFLGNGDATFDAPITIDTLPAYPNDEAFDIDLADMTGSGHLDLFILRAGTVDRYAGNGDGTFGSRSSYGIGGFAGRLGVADFNGDDVLDVTTADFFGGARFMEGNADGSFDPPQVIVTSTMGLNGHALGDVDGDGGQDVVSVQAYNHAAAHVTRNVSGALAAPSALTVETIETVGAVEAGKPGTIRWTVRNEGGRIAAGGWRDVVYLSTSPTWTPGAVPIGSVAKTGPMLTNQSYTSEITVPLFPVADGPQYVIVRSDVANEVPATPAAGRELSGAINLPIPVLTVGDDLDGQVAAGTFAFAKVEVPAGDDVRVFLATTGAADASRLFARRAAIATPKAFDLAATPGAVPGIVTLPESLNGTWYLTVQGRPPAGAGIDVQLSAITVPLSIDEVLPGTLGDEGEGTVRITGAGFGPDSEVRLIGPETRTPLEVEVVDSTKISALFELDGLPGGAYDVEVTVGTETVTAVDAVTVDGLIAGEGLVVDLSVLEDVRFRSRAPFRLTLHNPSGRDIRVPYVRFVSQEGALAVDQPHQTSGSEDDDDLHTEWSDVFVTSLGLGGKPGTIPPGATATITGAVIANDPDHANGPGLITLDAQVWSTDGRSPVEWGERLAPYRLADMSDAQWDAVVAHVEAKYGTTNGGFARGLSKSVDEAAAMGVTFDSIEEATRFLLHRALLTAPGADVTGTVLLGDDPLADVGVVISNIETSDEATTQTFHDGSFALWDLPPGVYHLSVVGHTPSPARTVRVEEGGAHDVVVTVTGTTPAPPAPSGGILTGRVTHPGDVAAVGAQVRATPTAGGSVQVGISGDDGTFLIEDVPTGGYSVVARTASEISPAVAATASANPAPVDLVLGPGLSIVASVTDADSGAPVAGAFVATAEGAGGFSDATGTVLIQGLPATQQLVTVDPPAGYLEPEQAPVTPAGPAALAIALTPLGSVSGTVTSGGPVVAEVVSATRRRADGTLEGASYLMTVSGAAGQYLIEGLAPGTWVVRVEAAGLEGVLTIGPGNRNPTLNLGTAPAVVFVAAAGASGRVVAQGSVFHWETGSLLPKWTVPESLSRFMAGSKYEPKRKKDDWSYDAMHERFGRVLARAKELDCPPGLLDTLAARIRKGLQLKERAYQNWVEAYKNHGDLAAENLARAGADALKLFGDSLLFITGLGGFPLALGAITEALANAAPGFQNLGALVDAVGDIGGSIASLFDKTDAGQLDQLASALGNVETGLLALQFLVTKLASDPALVGFAGQFGHMLSILGPLSDVIKLYADMQTIFDDLKNTTLQPLRDARVAYWDAVNQLNSLMKSLEVLVNTDCNIKKAKKDLTPEEVQRLTRYVRVHASADPNEVVGPVGGGPLRGVRAGTALGYEILFENLPSASAAAALVTVTTTLDDDVDLSTFELGDVRFADIEVDVPPGLQSYSTRLDLVDEFDEYVDVDASLDPFTRVVTWTLQGIDPATGLPEGRATAGFLVPNNADHDGEGAVEYWVDGLDDSPSGTTVEAQATIVFDLNDPIITNTWSNLVDETPPTSQVEPLAAITTTAAVTVDWTGTDGHSGIESVDLYVSVDGGPLQLAVADTADDPIVYDAVPGHTYGFATVARDFVGLSEDVPESPDATTQVEVAGPPVAAFVATPPAGAASLAVQFDARGSTSGLGPIAEYDWDFGDGTSGAGATTSHTYTQRGIYSPSLTVTDEDGGTDTVVGAAITVVRPPVAHPNSYGATSGDPLTVPSAGVLGNDVPGVVGDTLSAVLVDGVDHGALTLNANGSFTYTPTDGFHGIDSFTYLAQDQLGGVSAPVAVEFTVVLPPAPVAVGDAYTMAAGTTLTIGPSGVLGNDTAPPDSGPLVAVLVSGPAKGTLSLGGDGRFVYTPTPGSLGTDSFVYRATDVYGQSSAPVTVTITVNGNGPDRATARVTGGIKLSLSGPPLAGDVVVTPFGKAKLFRVVGRMDLKGPKRTRYSVEIDASLVPNGKRTRATGLVTVRDASGNVVVSAPIVRLARSGKGGATATARVRLPNRKLVTISLSVRDGAANRKS